MRYVCAMGQVTVTDARSRLPELLNRVARGEEVTITRHGQPVAVVIRPDALRSRRADAVLAGAAEVRDLLAAGRAMSLDDADGLDEARAEALVAEVRAGRARR